MVAFCLTTVRFMSRIYSIPAGPVYSGRVALTTTGQVATLAASYTAIGKILCQTFFAKNVSAPCGILGQPGRPLPAIRSPRLPGRRLAARATIRNFRTVKLYS